jgi:cytoskeletal protein RodZ
LRQRREELDLSLEQVEADTRIRQSYLEALESETFDALPDAVVGRGFLRNYARYLALDPQEASDRYTALVEPPQPESLSVEGPTPFTTDAFAPVPLHEIQSRRSRWLWIGALLLVLAVALALLAWWASPYLNQWWAEQQAAALIEAATNQPRETETGPATATHTPTATAAETAELSTGGTSTAAGTATATEATPTLELTFTPTFTPSPSPSPSPLVYTGIFLELVFSDTSWIQVSVDGVREFQGELEADTYRSWYGEERIELRVGNAGAVVVTVNGQLVGTLGAPGEVVDRVFEKVGDDVTEATVTPISTSEETTQPAAASTRPTATRQPTATAQPTAGPTVAPSATLTPTATITPTLTITPTATLTPTVSP